MKRPQAAFANHCQDQARFAFGQIFGTQDVQHFRSARCDRRSVRQVDEHYVMQGRVRLIEDQARGVEACQSARPRVTRIR